MNKTASATTSGTIPRQAAAGNLDALEALSSASRDPVVWHPGAQAGTRFIGLVGPGCLGRQDHGWRS